MKIEARIKVINAPQEGISKSTGNPWKRQEIILGWPEPYGTDGRTREQLVAVKLNGASVDKFAQLECSVGDVITGDLDFATRNFNGKVYNDISLYF